MSTSKAFGSKQPAHGHLVHSGGGLSGEVFDVRKDIDEAFKSNETPGHGGTGVVAVEEFTNVAAADDDAIKTVLASVAAAVDYSGAALNGVVAGAVMSPPRNITCTVAGGTPAHAPAHFHVDGFDVDGNAITEQIATNSLGGVTEGNVAFAQVTHIRMAAAGGAGATLKWGFGNKIGLGSKIKLRNGVPNMIAELLDGVVQTNLTRTDTFLAPAAKGVNYHAQFAAGAAIDASAAITKFYPPRNAQFVVGVGGVADLTITLTGTDFAGNTITETVACAGAGTYVGTKAFTEVTRIQSNKDPGGTVDVQTGDALGLSTDFSSIISLAKGVTLEAVAASEASSGCVTPTTVPNAALNYSVRYIEKKKGTYVIPATGLPHGTWTPAVAPNAAHDYTLVYERDLT